MSTDEDIKKGGISNRVKIIAIVGGIVVICLCGLIAFGAYQATTPEGEATSTARAAQREETRTEETAVAMVEATEAARPTDTPLPTNTPSPTDTPSISPTPTLSSLTIQEIEQQHENLTDLQWEDYKDALVGERVRWTGRVTEITDDGTFILDAGEESFLTSIYLDGVSRDTAIKINKDQIIEVEATIIRVSTFLGLSVRLDNPTDLVMK